MVSCGLAYRMGLPSKAIKLIQDEIRSLKQM
jgi:hypothetical protein